MRASLTSIRFKQFGHFHDVGPDGGFGDRAPLFGAFFERTSCRLTLHSAHKPCPTLKPWIDFRDLQPTQDWVVSRRFPLPMLLTIAVLTVRRWPNCQRTSGRTSGLSLSSRRYCLRGTTSA